MQTDKSATILEAQWLDQEIPRIHAQVEHLKHQEQELLTTPLETVQRAYTETYQAERRRAHLFYHRRRSVTPTRYGYRERMLDAGWFSLAARVIILLGVILAGYVVYDNVQNDHTQRGIIWGSVVLVAAIGLAFVPALGDQFWERQARKKAQQAADRARSSEAFAQEKQARKAELERLRTQIAHSLDRLEQAEARLDELRGSLLGSNHHDEDNSD